MLSSSTMGSVLPLFVPVTAIHSAINCATHFVLIRLNNAFPIAVEHIQRIGLLRSLIASAAAENDGCDAGDVLLQFPVDATEFTDDAVAILAGYTRVACVTMACDIPRNAELFWDRITSHEQQFLTSLLPMPQAAADSTAATRSLRYAFDVLRLAEFFQFDDLLLLLSGYVAIQLNRCSSTLEMRRLLGIPDTATQEDLFSAETLEVLRASNEWTDVPGAS